jgi:Transglutaminase-like superfamily
VRLGNWKARLSAMASILVIGGVGFFWSSEQQANGRMKAASRNQTAGQGERQLPSSAVGFSDSVASTATEKELEGLLYGKDMEIDLALANWLIAADVPELASVTKESYLRELDRMTESVRNDMAEMRTSGWRGADPKDPASGCRTFCNAMIRLRFEYCEEFRHENLTPTQFKCLHGDANNTFLAGLVRTRRGSCVSMPLVYLVIGRRLNLPVHLVTIGRHYFIRWEEPGYRVNIEPTIVEKVCVTPDESVYLETEGLRRDQVKGSDLRNLTTREVVGNLFFTRSCYWATKGGPHERERRRDLAWAHRLAPDDPAIEAAYLTVFNHYRNKPEYSSIDPRLKEQKEN